MNDQSDRTLIHHGRKFDFELVSFYSRTGAVIRREMVRHPGAVCILPVLEAPGRPPEIVLIRNRRFTIGKELFELPAGTLEKGEDPARCAPRELLEETGYEAREIIPLGSFYTTPGMTDERMHAFAARGLVFAGQRLEEDEEIAVVPTPLPKVLSMLDAGELLDAKSIVTLVLAIRRGVFHGVMM